MASTNKYEYTYKSRVQPRVNSSMHRSGGMSIPTFSSGGGGGGVRKTVEYSYQSSMSPQAFANVSNVGTKSIKNNREREKKDMQDLNERLATYIETVKFHEAQNKKMAKELEDLRNKWGKETSAIKQMYEGEITQLRKLLDDAEREKSEKDLKIKNHDDIVDDLRRQLTDLQELVDQLKDRVDKQDQQLSDYEGEIAMLRRRRDNLEDEKARHVREIARLTQELNQSKMDLDNETLNRIDLENQLQTLKEEMEFMKDVYEQQLKELAALAYRDTTAENRQWWKDSLGQCLRDIQEEYDQKLEMMRGDMEGFYRLKVQEFQTGAARNNVESAHTKEENTRMKSSVSEFRSKIGDLEARNGQLERELLELQRLLEEKDREYDRERSELEAELREVRAHMEQVLVEMQTLMDHKLSLELEIAAYRKLLEGEETRTGLRQVVDSVLGGVIGSEGGSGGFTISGGSSGGSSTIKSSTAVTTESGVSRSGGGAFGEAGGEEGMLKTSMIKGEMSAKTTYQRSAKGPITVTECQSEGKWVVIENTNKTRDEKLDGWKISRKIDGGLPIEYVFPHGTVLRGGKQMKVVSSGAQRSAGDLENSDITSWGVGSNIYTSLINDKGEERATHVQKTVYNS